MYELFKLLANTDVDMTVLALKEVRFNEIDQWAFDVVLQHRESTAYCRSVILVDEIERFSAADIVKLHFQPMINSIERNKNLTQEEYEAVIAGEQT